MRQHVARRPDESMGLLNEVMYRPVDLGYVEAAERRAAAELQGDRAVRRQGTTVALLVVAALLGAFTVAAVIGLRAPDEGAVEGRSLLVTEIERRSASASRVEDETLALSEEITRLQEEALGSAGAGLLEEIERSSVPAATTPVRGPGIVVELADAQDAGEPDADPASRVQAVDLQIVVNDLWAAGAEAVAINGRRLTSLSAIRGAGQAILIAPDPLLSPYRVEAIGDAATLQTRFARSRAAEELSLLQGLYGIRSSVRLADSLELPAAPVPGLRYATPAVDVGSSVADDEGSTT